ncbi:MAG: hypothetical protein DCC65_04135 [Planctomycetota bacterium]|nr:MAG: hypothetical protein DCC65_04135 [Planctomycetota bacterium]
MSVLADAATAARAESTDRSSAAAVSADGGIGFKRDVAHADLAAVYEKRAAHSRRAAARARGLNVAAVSSFGAAPCERQVANRHVSGTNEENRGSAVAVDRQEISARTDDLYVAVNVREDRGERKDGGRRQVENDRIGAGSQVAQVRRCVEIGGDDGLAKCHESVTRCGVVAGARNPEHRRARRRGRRKHADHC